MEVKQTLGTRLLGTWRLMLAALLAGGLAGVVLGVTEWFKNPSVQSLISEGLNPLLKEPRLLLALLPGVFVFLYEFMRNRERLEKRYAQAERYRKYRERYTQARAKGREVFLPWESRGGDKAQGQTGTEASPRRKDAWTSAGPAGSEGDSPRKGMRWFQLLVCTGALTIPFLFVASLSVKYHPLPESIAPGASTKATANPGDKQALTTTATSGADASASQGGAETQGEPLARGFGGLLFAGYGVFVYALLLLIFRLNASAVTPKFLMKLGFRATATLLVGFAVGLTGLSSIPSQNQGVALCFALGVFPNWAYDALRKRALAMLAPGMNSSALPLWLVSGVDDMIAERLEESGISDVQHLATTDPGELTIRTLYPFEQIIDWIDQAILITYLGEKIQFARKLGIRGAIDMAELYKASLDQGSDPSQAASSPNSPASNVLAKLATLCELDEDVMKHIGFSLREDYFVRFLANLWNHKGAQLSEEEMLAVLHPKIVESIGAALQQAAVAGATSEEPIPEAACDVSGLSEEFSKHLQNLLDPHKLEWKGTVEEVKVGKTFKEVYGTIIQQVTLKQ